MSGFKAFLTMWTSPRKTIRKVIETDPDSKLFILSLIYGLPMMFYYAQGSSLGQTSHLSTILLIALIGAVIVGYIGINIGSALLYFTGKWIGGKASFKQVRASVAYSNVTNIVSIAIWLILMAMFRSSVFMSDFPYASSLGDFAFLMNTIFFVQLIVAVWSVVIFIASLSETQGFSSFKAVINTLLPIGVMFVLLWILGLLFSLLGSGQSVG
jgi:hypothetical protein